MVSTSTVSFNIRIVSGRSYSVFATADSAVSNYLNVHKINLLNTESQIITLCAARFYIKNSYLLPTQFV
jgi:hypothetical protein